MNPYDLNDVMRVRNGEIPSFAQEHQSIDRTKGFFKIEAKMKERPILFSGPMVRAILEGRKTQTRRIIKASVVDGPADISRATRFEYNVNKDGPCINFYNKYYEGASKIIYSIGDHLWVKETFCRVDDTEFEGKEWIDYRATPKFGVDSPAGWDKYQKGDPDCAVWTPSIFMPRSASRITLEVLNVRIERLTNISEEDAIREGCLAEGPYAIATFADLWNSINGKKYPWESNPWVWVLEFRRIK